MDTPTNASPAASNSTPSGDLYAALAYLPPLLFILTMIKKGESPSHVWHAKNGAGVFVLAIVVNIIEQILVRTIGLYFLVPLLSLALLLLMLFAAWQAWNGKQLNIPVVTGIGQKIPLEKWFHKGMMDEKASSSATPAPSAPVETAPVASMPEPMPMTPAPVEAAAPVASMPEPMPMAPAPVEAAPMSASPASEPSVPPSAPEAPTQTPSA